MFRGELTIHPYLQVVFLMVSYAKYQSAKNRKNNILHNENKRKLTVLKTRVWEVSWKCLPRDVFVQVNLSNVMDPFFGNLSICSWLHVSIECSHVWNRSLPKWEEICFDVQKRLRSYFEMLARDCVCVNRFILWYGLVHYYGDHMREKSICQSRRKIVFTS